MKNSPALSIIIPVYNAGDFLNETLNSILCDNFTDFELIAIDDCSTDNSFEILNKFADQDNRVYVRKNESNIGKMNVVNKAFSLVLGSYILIFDADDINFFGRIKNQIEFLNKHPEVDMVYGDFFIHDRDGSNFLRKSITFEKSYDAILSFFNNVSKIKKLKNIFQVLHCTSYIAASSPIFRRKIIDDGITMDYRLRYMEDYDFLFNIIGNGYTLRYLSIPTFLNRMHTKQKSKEENYISYISIIKEKLVTGVYLKEVCNG